MIALSPSKLAPAPANPSTSSSSPPPPASFFPNSRKPAPPPRLHVRSGRPRALTGTFSKSSPEEAELSSAPEEDEWLKRLPDKTKPLYSHSLPCIEAWLTNLGSSAAFNLVPKLGRGTNPKEKPPRPTTPPQALPSQRPHKRHEAGSLPPPAHCHHCTKPSKRLPGAAAAIAEQITAATETELAQQRERRQP